MKQARDIGVAMVARDLRAHIGDWGFGTVVEALAHIADEYGDEVDPEEGRLGYDQFRDALRKMDCP